jgi:hypothetical protein
MSYGSGSLLLVKGTKKKCSIIIAFNDLLGVPRYLNTFVFNGYSNVQIGSGSAESVINWPPGSNSEYESADTEEIFTDS